jgi:nucleotidyltransferase substrate binding protein (TIGR01987 family)
MKSSSTRNGIEPDYFAWQGNPGITGSRDAAREAFQKGLVEDGEGWMEMIKSRNQTSHTYQQKIADEIAGKIIEHYFPLFQRFLDTMNMFNI